MSSREITSRELKRARHVHEKLQHVGRDLKDYADRLKGAPAEFMDNGLLQALAFYFRGERKGKAHAYVAEHVVDWLRGQALLGDGNPLEALVRLDAVAYRRCSEEAIAWLNLAKRLAAARLAMRERQ